MWFSIWFGLVRMHLGSFLLLFLSVPPSVFLVASLSPLFLSSLLSLSLSPSSLNISYGAFLLNLSPSVLPTATTLPVGDTLPAVSMVTSLLIVCSELWLFNFVLGWRVKMRWVFRRKDFRLCLLVIIYYICMYIYIVLYIYSNSGAAKQTCSCDFDTDVLSAAAASFIVLVDVFYMSDIISCSKPSGDLILS